MTHNVECVEWMRQQPDSIFDIILTSPPYNFDMPYSTYKDQITDYRTWTESWITHAIRLLKPQGRFIINTQPRFTHNEPYHHWIHQIMEKNQLLWYGERIWQKNAISGYRGAAGSMGTPSKPYLWYSTEYVQIYSKGSTMRPTPRKQSLITIQEQVAWARHHIWTIAPARQRLHPAQMPEELATRLLKLFARQGDCVFDPFAGAGTTLLTAHKLGLDSMGCELDVEYCALIEDKINAIK